MARITLDDLARACGVAKSTVSMALKGQRGIAPATIARVQAAAASLGWRPDPLLSAQGSHRRAGGRFLQLVHLAPTRAMPSRGPLVVQLKRAASAAGYHLREVCLDELPPGRSIADDLRASGAAGVLVHFNQHCRELGLEHLPTAVVLLGARQLDEPFHRCMRDNAGALRSSLDRLHAAGWRHLGLALMARCPPTEDDGLRLGTALRWLHEHPEVQAAPILRSGYEDRRGFLAWCEAHQPPAVVSFTSTPWDWLADLPPRRRPRAFVSLSVNAPDEPISGVPAMADAIADAAVELADQLIRTRAVGRPAIPRRRNLGQA